MKVWEKIEVWEEDYEYNEDLKMAERLNRLQNGRWWTQNLTAKKRKQKLRTSQCVAVDYEAPDLYEIYKSPASITTLIISRSQS